MCPVVLTRGADQEPLSTKFDQRSDPVGPPLPPPPPFPPTSSPNNSSAASHLHASGSGRPALQKRMIQGAGRRGSCPGREGVERGAGAGAQKVIRSYGKMVVELAAVVPDGLVCFFVSYRYMDQIVAKWNDMGILNVPAPPPPPNRRTPRTLPPSCTPLTACPVSNRCACDPVTGGEDEGRDPHSCCSHGSQLRAALS